jgi:DNA-binding transcriptional MerR regulator/DNA-directed RNA polymerase subunit RPC12/RpoP
MSHYTTGDLAKSCDVSVRTVQFYDGRGLLKPTELSEGGRRLYSEADLAKLRLICLLKSLGLSLDSIKGILESETPGRVLLLLLDEQEKRIDEEIRGREKQKKAIEIVKESIRNADMIAVNSIRDIEKIMDGKKKLKRAHIAMLVVGIFMDLIEIGTIVLWITRGIWLPFAVGMPIVIVMGILITRMYYRNAAYICPECSATFRPRMKEFIFSKHTPKTRKLRCTHCGYLGYCVETYTDAKTGK